MAMPSDKITGLLPQSWLECTSEPRKSSKHTTETHRVCGQSIRIHYELTQPVQWFHFQTNDFSLCLCGELSFLGLTKLPAKAPDAEGEKNTT